MTVFDEFNEVKRKGLPQILVIFGESKEMVQELKSQLLTFVNFEPTDLSQSYYDLTPNNSDLALEDLESLPFFSDSRLVILENLVNLTTAKKTILDEKQLKRFENFLDNLDLTQKGWTSKLVSRIENALINGGEEIEFNLKPKNLGVLKVSVKLKNGIGNVKIITENSFVTSALNQNENYLQKLFNEQGINLDFTAQNEGQNFGSKNNFNQNSKNEDKKNTAQSESDIKKTSEEEIDTSTENNSSRHMINVIA